MHFGNGMHQLLIRQFFSLSAQFKTTTKSHENYVFLYPFSNMAIFPQNNEKTVLYTSKLYGLTGMLSTLTKNDATFPKLHNDTVPQLCVICK